MSKLQDEGLEAIKQTQEASLAWMNSWREFTKEFSDKPGTMPTFENIPSPTQFVEMSFGFADRFLELRKSFTMKVAEMMSETQKRAEANFKAATPSQPAPNQPMPNRPPSK
ncbi:MAG: hypothetical protein JO030_06390 [Candidatus Eremiobacteraeota bacterium]|nr:hypothetical protein [Candidatus Eremiobacteraeota bacterium]